MLFAQTLDDLGTGSDLVAHKFDVCLLFYLGYDLGGKSFVDSVRFFHHNACNFVVPCRRVLCKGFFRHSAVCRYGSRTGAQSFPVGKRKIGDAVDIVQSEPDKIGKGHSRSRVKISVRVRAFVMKKVGVGHCADSKTVDYK